MAEDNFVIRTGSDEILTKSVMSRYKYMMSDEEIVEFLAENFSVNILESAIRGRKKFLAGEDDTN